MLYIIGFFLLLGVFALALKNIKKIIYFNVWASIIVACVWLLFEYPLETMLFVAFAIIVATFTSKISNATFRKKIEAIIQSGGVEALVEYYTPKSNDIKRKTISCIQRSTDLHTKKTLLQNLFVADFIGYMSKRSNSSKKSIVEKNEIENYLDSIWQSDELKQYKVGNISDYIKETKYNYTVSFESPRNEKGKRVELVKLFMEPEGDLFENAINLD